ncbi:MAG: hypothetical protein IEMM0001_1731 [bacterium]|nr:MAG: hypothetical protein IEMM0001_1731 [bacterium]
MLLLLLAIGSVEAGGIRDRIRPDVVRNTAVSESQATELTLTLVRTAPQNLQTWVRTAAELEDTGTSLVARLCAPYAELIRAGQRVRAFPPDSKSSIYQARVTRVVPEEDCATVEARLAGKMYEKNPHYVMEIVVQRGEFLSIPNEAIIEEGDRQIVYVQQRPGNYTPQEIRTGLKGELYTQIYNGLNEGDQVVTLGSFFIDADYKLKSTQQDTKSNAHIHH